MAITVKGTDPQDLLASIKRAIDERRIETWSYDGDGDFTHSVVQWQGKAWLRPAASSGTLVLHIIGPKDVGINRTVYAIYHGRFVEMLLRHFDKQFKSVEISALAIAGDNVKG